MASMFCPRCAKSQVMNLSTTEQEITGPGGEKIRLVIQNYHCANCHSFVSSESIHEHDKDAGATQPRNGRKQHETEITNG